MKERRSHLGTSGETFGTTGHRSHVCFSPSLSLVFSLLSLILAVAPIRLCLICFLYIPESGANRSNISTSPLCVYPFFLPPGFSASFAAVPSTIFVINYSTFLLLTTPSFGKPCPQPFRDILGDCKQVSNTVQTRTDAGVTAVKMRQLTS